ncbi:protein Jumonji-like [Lytechinus variegatus]|uniref:protein Jumonji-like n=1 Tax=Lytechinus variegatus TaxID=7654 RepID=UPI001BB2CA42|nr:protein Jumonji-like [Lytechinus variegatus]
MHRWKSRSKKLECIKRHLEEREKVAYYPPQISGYEIDLVEFSLIVAQQGGLKTITSNKRWNKVADLLHIPKPLQSRVKLDSIYCKFLLSFDNLSKEEKQRLEMETEFLRKQQGASRLRSHDHEFNSFEEVICKGRPTTLSAYSRMASLTQQMLYKKPNPLLGNVEVSIFILFHKLTYSIKWLSYYFTMECKNIEVG